MVKTKQIDAVFSGYVRAINFSANGASNAVTSAISATLGVAARGGGAVPVQVSSGDNVAGVITATNGNRVELYDTANKNKMTDGNGNEVYGRLTESGGAYTLTYYSLVNGTETAYTTFSARGLDFEFLYRYPISLAPAEVFVGSTARNINQDPTGAGARTFSEARTPTGTDAVPNLTFTPDQNYNIQIIVNGVSHSTQESPTPFTVSGKVVSWSAANAGYSLDTSDKVIVRYTTLN